MAELLSAEQQKYCRETEDSYTFLDPILGVELQPGVPSPCLQADPFAGPGIDQLHKLAQEKRLTIQLVLSPHSHAEDLDDVLREFGEVLDNATMAGVESGWDSSAQGSAGSDFSVAECEIRDWWRAFGEPLTMWLDERGKLILPCGILYDDSTELATAFRILIQMWNSAYDAGEMEVFSLIEASYQTTRQWVFFAHLGYWLRQLDKAGLLPAGDLKLPLIIGIGHAGIERKAQKYFGIPVEVYKLRNSTKFPLNEAYEAKTTVFADATFNGRLTHKDLATLVDMHNSWRNSEQD